MKRFTQLIALLGASFFFVVSPAFADTTGYTNYWSFDDATGRSIGDTGGQNGVLTGSSTGLGWASGKVGTALAMGGTTGEGVALPNGFLTGSQGTLSVWFKFDEMTDRNVIFSAKSTTDNNIYSALIIEHEGRPQFQFRTDPSGSDRRAQVTKILNKNEWYNLVFVATGVTYKAYVNGEEQTIAGDNNGRWFPDITNHTLSYRIGTSEATPLVGSFTGMLDEMRIYNRVLSAEEVTTLYNEGNNGRPTVPLAIRPELAFSISSDSVAQGGSVTLNWTGAKVDTCSASEAWSGAVETTGTRTFTGLTNDQSYTLTCGGKGGSVSASVRVQVGAVAPATGGTLTVTDVTPAKPVPETTDATLAQAFTRSLTVGTRSDDVKRLQLVLVANSFLASEHATGYFGALTKEALIKFQTKHGINATGYFGPLTMAKMNALSTDGSAVNTLTVPSTAVLGSKDAKIAELMMLIAELQKALAAMKAGTTY